MARCGAGPTLYLVGADGSGHERQLPAGGEEIQTWDCSSRRPDFMCCPRPTPVAELLSVPLATMEVGFPSMRYGIVTAAICRTLGQITVAAPFWATEGFTLTRTDLTTQEFTFPKGGAGHVPMLRAVGPAIADGRLEHDTLPMADTIAVMEILEEIMRQIREQ